MTEGKLIQEVHGYVSWAKNGFFKEKHCATKIIEAAKSYAAAQVAAKDSKISQLEAENARIEAAYKALLTLPTLAYESDSDEVKALKAELRRVRDGVIRILGKNQIYEGFVLVLPDTLGEFLSPADGDGVGEAKDENGLLPCPFCGGKASGLSIPFGFFSVECASCKFFLMEKESAQLITEDWNRRAGRGTGG